MAESVRRTATPTDSDAGVASAAFGRRDRGLGLVELLVTISLTTVLGIIVLAGVLNNHKLHRNAVDEATGLGDVKTVTERLGRDIRSARSVGPFSLPNGTTSAAATASQLVLWVDYNSDYIKTDNEIVTWQVVPAGSGAQYNVLRQTEGGTVVTEARTLVSQLAFCYWTQSAAINQADCTGSLAVPLSLTTAASTRLITTTMTYDAYTNYGTANRKASFSDRLRNVE